MPPMAMKLRTLLLGTLMVVVPLLAMFSHLIPAEVRAATRHQLRSAVDGWFATASEAGQPAMATEPAAADLPADPLPAAPSKALPAEGRPVAAGAPLPPSNPGQITGMRPIAAASRNEVEPELVAQLADRSRHTRDQQAVESRLHALGAIAFECQPVPGTPGLFASACRVPVDPTGQLQRVFQATGNDPATATEALVAQVQAWRQRPPQPATAFPSAEQP
jgi:hypothetical protein